MLDYQFFPGIFFSNDYDTSLFQFNNRLRRLPFSGPPSTPHSTPPKKESVWLLQLKLFL